MMASCGSALRQDRALGLSSCSGGVSGTPFGRLGEKPLKMNLNMLASAVKVKFLCLSGQVPIPFQTEFDADTPPSGLIVHFGKRRSQCINQLAEKRVAVFVQQIVSDQGLQ